MGNSHYQGNNNAQGNVQSEWRMKQKTPYMNIWCRKDNANIELEQYQFYINDERQFLKQKGLYYLRKAHPNLVATQYFSERQQKDFCASSYKGTIFVERIPLRLSNVTDIPFPDILHLYQQSIKGFQILSKQFGYFHINEDKVCINQQGVAKIWLNQQLQRSYPPKKIESEFQMVLGIFKTLQKNTDTDTMPNVEPSIQQFVYRDKGQKQVGFALAQIRIKDYIDKFNNGRIPQRLQCFDKVGGTIAVAQKLEDPNILIQNPDTQIARRSPLLNNKQNQILRQSQQGNIKNVQVMQQLSDSSRNNKKQMGESQLARYRSVSPPISRVNQNNINSDGYKANRTMVSSGFQNINTAKFQGSQANVAKFQGSNIRMRSHQLVKKQQGFRGSNVVKIDSGSILKQSGVRFMNQAYAPHTKKNSQVQFTRQLQPRQVVVMETIKAASNRKIAYKQPVSSPLQTPPNTQLRAQERTSGLINEKSQNQRLGSDIFEARQVQESNIVQNSSSRKNEVVEPYKSNIGKEKPIYQSNVIGQNNEAVDGSRLTSQASKYSSDWQSQWRDYTQQHGSFSKQFNKQQQNNFSRKVDHKVYQGQVINSEVRNSSSELLDELKKVRQNVNQEISRSRHEAEKEAFILIKKQPDHVRETYEINGNQVVNNTQTGSFNPNSAKSQLKSYYAQSEANLYSDQKQTSGKILRTEEFSEFRKPDFNYQAITQSPLKSQGYHIQYDSQLLADLNAMK